MKMRTPLWVLGALTLFGGIALLIATACGDGGDEGSSVDAREMRVRSTDDLRFEPAEIRLKAGEPVRLMVENMGASVHDFTIDEMPIMGGGDQGGPHDVGDGMNTGSGDYAMHVSVEGHRDGLVEFTPTERGTYTFYCSVEGHRQAGMEGRMIVE